MNGARDTAHHAYRLAREQLRTIRAGDFERYEGSFEELEATYTELLRTPMAEFDDEARAVTSEVVSLQRDICHELDAMMDAAAGALASQRRKRAVSSAYRVPGQGTDSAQSA